MEYELIHIEGSIGRDYTVQIKAPTDEGRAKGVQGYMERWPTWGYATRVTQYRMDGTTYVATIRRHHSCD